MNLVKMKAYPSLREAWVHSTKKAIICLALFFPLILSQGCSESDDPEETETPPDTTMPYSVNIASSNKNMPSGGILTSEFSDSPSGFDISRIADNNATTKFVTNCCEFYILWAGGKNVAVNYYTLTSADDAPEKDPKSWTLSGSIDKAKWVELDTQAGQTFSARKETKEYKIENKIAYKYFRIDIKSNNGDAATQIAEWTMEEQPDPLIPHSVTIYDSNKNLPSGGVLTSEFSDSPLGSDIAKAVDSNLNTKYSTAHSAFYIQWAGSKTLSINNYSLTSADDAPEKDPKSWTISGSNDQLEWVVIETQNNQTFSKRNETKKYVFVNKVAYKYYRLNILTSNGGAGTQISELTMEYIPTDISDLMQYSGGNTHSTKTPMGTFFENRRVATDADLAWLKNASDEPVLGVDDKRSFKEYSVTLYPYGSPLPADANQHGIGNCSAIAVFASMAYIYPDFVKSLIKDNGDKTYTVDMFDPLGKAIKVSVSSKFLADSNGNITCVTGKNNKAVWTSVLEKAMMKYNVVYKINGSVDLGGIGTEHTLPLFTGDGDSFSFSPGKLTADQLARVVNVCLREGKFVVGGFRTGDVPVEGTGTKTVTGHAYTLMHSTSKTALFIMRNPWGGNPDVDGSKDGVVDIPNNSQIPPLIDFRIVYPGKATQYGSGVTTPYTPPILKGAEAKMRVADHLLRGGVLR